MSMIFRESGREGHETVRFVRTFYCSEAKAGRQKTLGKIKKADATRSLAQEDLLAELGKNGATEDEIAEILEWIDVMVQHKKEESLQRSKEMFLGYLAWAATANDSVLKMLTKEDTEALFSNIKKLEERLREHGIKRPRKPRK